MFKCIISHSSTKSSVPPLHKFTIQKLDLFFFFFGKLNLLNIAVYLLTFQYFGRMEKKFVPQESRIEFCRLFIVQVKKVCYERKVQGELLGSYFHCTLDWLHQQAPTTTFRLMVLRNRAKCQCYKETNIPPCLLKTQQKITIFNFVLCQVRLILFDTNLITKNNILYVKTVVKDTLSITANFVKSQYKRKKHFGQTCLYFFVVELFLQLL